MATRRKHYTAIGWTPHPDPERDREVVVEVTLKTYGRKSDDFALAQRFLKHVHLFNPEATAVVETGADGGLWELVTEPDLWHDPGGGD